MARRRQQQPLGHTAHQHLAYRRAVARPDHEQLGVDVAHDVENVVGDIRPDPLPHLVIHTGQPRLECLQGRLTRELPVDERVPLLVFTTTGATSATAMIT